MCANLLFELPVDLLDQRFLATDSGKPYRSIPFDELAGLVADPKRKLSGKGRISAGSSAALPGRTFGYRESRETAMEPLLW